MTDTLTTYQHQQSNIVSLLEKLDQFVRAGAEFGLSLTPEMKSKLAYAIQKIEGEKLKVVLVGGFSEGKTSIAAAWLGKLDQSSMKISASESSNEVKVYEIDDSYVLIDTPGLFGFEEQENLVQGIKEKYKDITKKYVSEAHIILYVMNPKNPVKESHKSDLIWLFRELNLLPRTVFVLGRFDEVADVEDEQDYQLNLKIKRQNVKDRLNDLLSLSDDEQNTLNIVGVSANPFDEGVDYWLENQDEFKSLSHIDTLQEATRNIIQKNGGYIDILNETRKSIFNDILLKEMPIIENKMENIDRSCKKIGELYELQERDFHLLTQKISNAKLNLQKSFNSFFTDYIVQVQGASMETIGDFMIREIGQEGCIIDGRIQHIFERETNQISTTLNTQAVKFNAEIDSIDTALETMTKKGVNHLVKNVKINNQMVLAARDGLVAGGKAIGVNLSKYLKFKPYGAIKFASKLNAAFAFTGIAMEAWDSWQQAKRKEEFEKAQKQLINDLQSQQQEILKIVGGSDFIQQFFPLYAELQQKIQNLKTTKVAEEDKQERFKQWRNQGETIEGEFRELK